MENLPWKSQIRKAKLEFWNFSSNWSEICTTSLECKQTFTNFFILKNRQIEGRSSLSRKNVNKTNFREFLFQINRQIEGIFLQNSWWFETQNFKMTFDKFCGNTNGCSILPICIQYISSFSPITFNFSTNQFYKGRSILVQILPKIATRCRLSNIKKQNWKFEIFMWKISSKWKEWKEICTM